MNIKNVIMSLITIIIIQGCGQKNTRNEPSQNKGQTDSSLTAVKTLNIQSSLGKTNLLITTGDPSAANQLQKIGEVTYTTKKTNYERGESGYPSASILDISSPTTYPVYLKEKDNNEVQLLTIVPNSVAEDFIKKTLYDEAQTFETNIQPRCLVHTVDLDGLHLHPICDFYTQLCSLSPNTPAVIPEITYKDFHCDLIHFDFIDKKIVHNTAIITHLMVHIDPHQNSLQNTNTANLHINGIAQSESSSFQESELQFEL